MLKITPFVLGPIENNTFLLVDKETKQAALVDPAFDSRQLIPLFNQNQWTLTHILCTHAHFDHIAGINEIDSLITPETKITLHPKDLPLWEQSGGAKQFGVNFTPTRQPTHLLEDEENIPFSGTTIKSIFTPGHTPGHVVYSLEEQNLVFCGDLIFRQSVGRTDLPGGSHLLLLRSIDQKIRTLPPETRLLSGHGPETTVGFEIKYNPFL